MALARYQFTVVDDEGNAIPAASIEVREEVVGSPIVSIYSDRNGVTPLGNPFSADAEGFAAFHVAGGAYRITATSGAFSRVWRYVGIGTASEFDLEELDGLAVVQQVDAGYALLFESETSAPPSSGSIRFNNASLSAATEAYVSVENAAGSEIIDRLLELYDAARTVKDAIIISDPSGGSQASWQVTGATDDGSPATYVTLTLASHNGATSLTDGSAVNLQRERAGADGADGSIAGSTGSTDNALLRASGTGGSTVDSTGITVDDSNNLAGAASLGLLDTNASHNLKLAAGSNITAERTLTLTTGDADRTLTLNGDVTPMGQGKHTIWIPATAMVARTTNGAASGTGETATNKVMRKSLDFDTSTQEFAQFQIAMPKSWNESTVTFQAVWSHAATVTNFGVVWALQGLAISDDDTLEAAFGTEQTSTDTGGTTDDLYISPESSAITIGGTPAENDYVVFQVKRVPSDGSDTLGVDARLHGVKLFYTTSAATDA